MVEEREEGSHRSAWQYPIKYGYRPDAGAALPRLRCAGLAGLALVFFSRRGRQEPRRRRMQHDERIRIDSLGIPLPRDDNGGVLAQRFSGREGGGGEGNGAQGRREDEAFHGVLLSNCFGTATPHSRRRTPLRRVSGGSPYFNRNTAARSFDSIKV